MKKLIALLLSFAMVFPAAACGSGSAAAPKEQAEEGGSEEAAGTDLTGKLASLNQDISGLTSFKEVAPDAETGEEDKRANEELKSLLKVNDSAAEVEASLQSNMQILSYGGVIFQVPAAWKCETTQEGYLMTYPEDGHCFVCANGTGVRGYDMAQIMNSLKDGLTSNGQTVSEFSAGGKDGLKAEYYGNSGGVNVKVTDYYFLPNDTWLLQMQCVSVSSESFDSVMQTLDFTHSVVN